MDRLTTHVIWPDSPRIIYMSFVRNKEDGTAASHQNDLRKTPISRRFVFAGAEKVYEAARRGNGLMSMESRHGFQEAVTAGKGGIWLSLNQQQYAALVLPKPSISNKNRGPAIGHRRRATMSRGNEAE
jgi:hypothetical protein